MAGCGHDCNCETYREHLLSIGFGSKAMPTRRPEAAAINAREERWQRDMPAYKEMRRQGVQPRGIDGAHELAMRANDRLEVETGNVMTRGQVTTAKAIIEDMAS